jgi:hypothetical protein
MSGFQRDSNAAAVGPWRAFSQQMPHACQPAVSGRGLSHLSGLSELIQLDLTDTRFSNAEVVHVKQIDEPENVATKFHPGSDAGLAELETAMR